MTRYKAEAFDVWQYLCGQTYEPLIRWRIDISGRIDEETLMRAITLSLETIPLIGCCFDGSGRKPYWVDKGFTGKDMVRVVEVDGDAEAEIIRVLSSGIDAETEPQLKIGIVRAPEGDTMCIAISHLVCDGTGFKDYLSLVADIYTRLKSGQTVPAPQRYPRSTRPLYKRTGWLERIRLLRAPQPVREYSLKDQIGVDFNTGETTPYLEYRTLSPRDFAAFKTFAVAHRATVNDALMAVFARAFCRETTTTHLAFTSTIDFRRFIPPGVPYGITNYAGNCVCGIAIDPREPLEATFAKISSQMQEYKIGKISLQQVIGWDLAVRFISFAKLKKGFTRQVPASMVAFTNPGILDTAGLDFDGAPIRSAYMTASIKPRPYFQVLASTFEGACTLTCNVYGSQQEQQFADRVLDDIVREISEPKENLP